MATMRSLLYIASLQLADAIVHSLRSDTMLIREALTGERQAQRELAARLLDTVHQEVGHCLLRWSSHPFRRSRQDVRDLVQDVLVSLFECNGRELRRWDPERGRSLSSFVRLIARRRVARILARDNCVLNDAHGDMALVSASESDEPHTRTERRLELDALLRALHAQMSLRDVDLFDRLFIQDLDPNEVALAMGLSRGAVNAWAYRMRKLARDLAGGRDVLCTSKTEPAKTQVNGV